jgi:predicted aspartyl protease
MVPVDIPLIVEPDPEDPAGAEIMVEGAVMGRPRRFLLDTGAARTQVVADDVTAALRPVGQHRSAGVFAAGSSPLVTVQGLTVGPLTVPELDVVRVAASQPGARDLVGMDVLQNWCCYFRFGRASLSLQPSPARQAGRLLDTDASGHFYVDVTWTGVTARACWDSGASITVVDRALVAAHPGLFQPAGDAAGTDSTGAQARTPVFLAAGMVIGGARFSPHKVAAVDLAGPNRNLDRPMDLILGYPALRQADWLFDFPARRWALTQPPGVT